MRFIIETDLIPSSITVLVDEPWKAVPDIADTLWNNDCYVSIEEPLPTEKCRSIIYDRSSECIIWIGNYTDYFGEFIDGIYHECAHCAFHIMRVIGNGPSKKGPANKDEILIYLQCWYARQILGHIFEDKIISSKLERRRNGLRIPKFGMGKRLERSTKNSKRV